MEDESSGTAGRVPQHLLREPTLRVRHGERIVDAPAADQEVARGYPHWPDKGPVTAGVRLTLMCARRTVRASEEVRVVHVLEATGPGEDVYVMGPKPVLGEIVDGRPATAPAPAGEKPWVPRAYDGVVLPGPAADYSYEITSYRFEDPGMHRIQWSMGDLRSNVLTIEVTDATE